MNTEYETLNGRRWEHPSYYGGFSPDGDFMIVGQSRDSDALERSNYKRVFEDLQKLAESLPEAPERDDIESGNQPWVYDFRAGHWAVGWVEQVLIRQDAPDELLAYAEEILNALANYPVYDESHYSELEWEEAQAYWEGIRVSERVELCQKYDISVFAARHDYIPQDDSGSLYDYLRS